MQSNMSLYLEEGAVLLGIQREESYPLMAGRVAGIEMDWPAGVLNIRDAENVYVHGSGTIDGQGEYWWEKYWGTDGKGGMRRTYEERNLRWAVDYDCFRTRNVIVWNSRKIRLGDFTSRRSGFWNIHVCYSEDVRIEGIRICDNRGPSTDGIDIDSCRRVVVERCEISCNDDNICIKSGRDADGLRVGKVCEDILIRDCTILEGQGITIGSETSGGARHIRIEGNRFIGTANGFRLKSARTRGGMIQDVSVKELEMFDVSRPFDFQFNWYPAYSYCVIPKEYEGEVPPWWGILTQPAPEKQALPRAEDIRIQNVRTYLSRDYRGEAEAFHILGLAEAPFRRFLFQDIKLEVRSFGVQENITDSVFTEVEIRIK